MNQKLEELGYKVEETFAIAEDINAAVHRDANSQTRDYIGMSQLPYCARKIYFDAVIGKAIDEKGSFRVMSGTAIHAELQRILWKERGRMKLTYKKSEKDLKIEYPGGEILGHLDFEFKYNDIPMVVDFKTTKDTALSFLRKGPRIENVRQVNLYLVASGHERGAIFYITREGKYKFFEFLKNEDDAAELIEKHRFVRECIKNETPPEIPFKDPDENWQCQFCTHYNECWNYAGQFQRVEEEIILDPSYESKILTLEAQKKVIEKELYSLQNYIGTKLGGKKGKTEHLTFSYTPPSTYMKVSAKLVKAKLPAETVREVIEEVHRKGGYRMTKRGLK